MNSFHMLQDAQKLWQRNKDEEGGGGYVAWNWDSSIWGADVLLAAQTSDPKYGAEVCVCKTPPICHLQR